MKKDACEVNLRAFGGVVKRRKRGFSSEWLEREPFWTIALSRNCLLKIVQGLIFKLILKLALLQIFFVSFTIWVPHLPVHPFFYSKFEELLVITMSVRKTVQPKIVSPVFNIIKCLSSFGAWTRRDIPDIISV